MNLKPFKVAIPNTKKLQRRAGTSNQRYIIIDTVYFDETMDNNEVINSLIEHNGYPANILIVP